MLWHVISFVAYLTCQFLNLSLVNRIFRGTFHLPLGKLPKTSLNWPYGIGERSNILPRMDCPVPRALRRWPSKLRLSHWPCLQAIMLITNLNVPRSQFLKILWNGIMNIINFWSVTLLHQSQKPHSQEALERKALGDNKAEKYVMLSFRFLQAFCWPRLQITAQLKDHNL